MDRFGRVCLMASVLAGVAAGAASAPAEEVAGGPATWSTVVHHLDAHPRSARAARISLDRLGDAAMEVCGASSFSLREVQAGIRASRCWRDSMTDVLSRIGDPVLIATYRTQRPDRR